MQRLRRPILTICLSNVDYRRNTMFQLKLYKNEKMSIGTFSNGIFCAIISSNENYIIKYMRKSDV